ncbi:MAG: hypothetical protein ACO1OB_01815 [Archangium sp.]
MQVAFVVGIVLFVVFIFLAAQYIEKKRREKMQAYAEARGFAFEGEAYSFAGELNDFKLFNQGHSTRVKNAMHGVKDVGAVHICDYQYTTGSGKNRHTHHQTIAVVRTPGRRAPHFFLRRQNRFFDALGKLFGGQDINFEEDPDFSKTYVLQTSGDEELLRRFFSPALREVLTRLADRNFVIEVNGESMLIHRARQLSNHEDIDALLSDATNIRRHWA